ncbi:MAG TPA: PDC sensor domain-containing protein [Candidatus Solibacter sp.]|jgi:hypothetical protein|nr:PDC sensor domain-containing protein [Candidatus Solibacter sp.]
MRVSTSVIGVAALAALFFAGTGWSQSMSPEVKAKVEAKIKQLQGWSLDPAIVAAVKDHNSHPRAEDQAMTNEKWAKLTVLDPYVRAFSKNPVGVYLKSKKDDQIAECFVSGSDGTKVAFLAKTTSWSHADKDKHKTPMAGKTYIGPVAVDESTGLQLVQIGLPVLDGGKPIGSIVVGLALSKLQ